MILINVEETKYSKDTYRKTYMVVVGGGGGGRKKGRDKLVNMQNITIK